MEVFPYMSHSQRGSRWNRSGQFLDEDDEEIINESIPDYDEDDYVLEQEDEEEESKPQPEPSWYHAIEEFIEHDVIKLWIRNFVSLLDGGQL
jgi:hypothetical protein